MRKHVLRQSDDGKTVNIALGDELLLHLAENPTTGYGWEFSSPLEATGVSLLYDTFEPPTSRNDGAGGLRILTLRAQKKGQTILKLAYRRPWEREEDTPMRITFTLNIM
ncbi:protease inhibitor I42 family protein [Desulfobaculum xiamenense]|nr:protease inhibitor I42 family protein [Desulfobaculum xiamenense]